jgi:hypothetical protein
MACETGYKTIRLLPTRRHIDQAVAAIEAERALQDHKIAPYAETPKKSRLTSSSEGFAMLPSWNTKYNWLLSIRTHIQ